MNEKGVLTNLVNIIIRPNTNSWFYFYAKNKTKTFYNYIYTVLLWSVVNFTYTRRLCHKKIGVKWIECKDITVQENSYGPCEFTVIKR